MEERLRALRKRAGLTQSQIGDFLNVDQSTVAKIEAGERKITTVQLDKLANLYGCSEDYLLEISGEETTLQMALRSSDVDVEILNTIAEINRVAANMRMLNKLLEE